MDEMIDRTGKKQDDGKSCPTKKTLDFLTRFSRAYHAEGSIRQEFCDMVMN
jgi:hypothetical protein